MWKMQLWEEKLESIIREISNARRRGTVCCIEFAVRFLLIKKRFEKRLEGDERLSQETL